MRFLTLILCSCGGNIRDVKTRNVESKIYAQEEIADAIDVIRGMFKLEWSGCTLKEIYYAGDEMSMSKGFSRFAKIHNADDVLVLISTFDVDSSDGDGSLNPNHTYNRWNWILVRDKGGKWRHVEHGY